MLHSFLLQAGVLHLWLADLMWHGVRFLGLVVAEETPRGVDLLRGVLVVFRVAAA